MALPTVTVDDVMASSPCRDYTRDRVKRLFGRRRRLNVLDVLALREVPAEDRVWAALHAELIPIRGLHTLACRITNRAMRLIYKAGYRVDGRSCEAVRVKRRWLCGTATDAELEAAGLAADRAWADAFLRRLTCVVLDVANSAAYVAMPAMPTGRGGEQYASSIAINAADIGLDAAEVAGLDRAAESRWQLRCIRRWARRSVAK